MPHGAATRGRDGAAGGETEQQGAQGEGHGRPGGAGRQRGAGVVGAMWQKGGAQCVRWLVLLLESCCSVEPRERVGVTVEGYAARVLEGVRDGTPRVWCTCGVRRRRGVWRKVAATPVAVCENGHRERGRYAGAR